jgi:pyruvate/2-oxoglutarate dehydrogenase complex dihydrolipoamide acyltransferase (E2) component
MATLVTMPKLGMNMEDGVVVRWLVAEGAEVKNGQEILEIETDKATTEIEAPAAGILARIVRREGETVPINGVMAVILAPGEEMPATIPDTSI